MPDIFGTIYEGILAYAVKENGLECSQAPPPPESCRTMCKHRQACRKIGSEINLTVDPDLIVRLPRGRAAVIYSTHWRTADSFQKKFWRTLEELFQYRVHRPDYLHVNWVFEPLQIKRGLLVSMSKVFDCSEDYSDSWSAKHQSFIAGLQSWADDIKPVSIDAVVTYCRSSKRSAAERSFLNDVVTRMKAVIDSLEEISEESPLWVRMRDNCFESQKRKQVPHAVQERTRTPLQLGAIVQATADRMGVEIDLEALFNNGMLRCGTAVETKKLSAALASIPVRRARGQFRHLGRENIGRIGFDADFIPAVPKKRARRFATLAQNYLRVMDAHPTWSAYFDSVAGGTSAVVKDLGRAGVKGAVSVNDYTQMMVSAASDPASSWLLEVALCGVERNLNDLNRDLDGYFESEFDTPLKRLAPFGDSGIHVIGALNKGDWEQLREIPGQSHAKTVSLLWDQIRLRVAEYANDGFLDSVAAVAEAYVYKRMKTLLSRAPHPLAAAIRAELITLGYAIRDNPPIPNFINDIARGKTGRYEVNFEVSLDDASWYVNLVTAQDGNEGHKRKEIAGRQRAAGIAWDREASVPHLRQVTSICILDGEWSEAYVQNLLNAGFVHVVAASEWDPAVLHVVP